MVFKQFMIQKLKSLKNHQDFMKYFRNTSWLFIEKILRVFIGLFVGIWVARYLGPEQFGVFSYAESFVGLFVTIATFGLDGIVVRELVKHPERRDELLGTAFGLKLFGAILVLSILFFAINLTSNDYQTNMLVFIIAGGTVFQSFNVIDFYFQSKVLSKYITYANIVTLLLSSIIKILLILNNAPLLSFAFVVLFDSFILALGFIYVYKYNNLYIRNWKINFNTMISLLKDSWPLILSGFVISIYMRADQIMIKEMLDSVAVGHYAAAVKLSQALYFLPTIITSSLFPAIINSKELGKDIYFSRIQKLYDLMAILSISIAIPTVIFSHFVVNNLYGTDYAAAAEVLIIHTWAGVFVFFGVASSSFFMAENMTIKLFYRTLFGVTINIILNYFLIPKYGIQGAAIATLVGQFFANYIFDIFDKDLRYQFKMKTKAILYPFRFLIKV